MEKEKALLETDNNFEYLTVSKPVLFSHQQGNLRRYTSLYPANNGEKELNIQKIVCGWKPFSTIERRYLSIKPHDVAISMESFPQGYPLWRYNVSKIVSFIGIWKHHDRVTWPQNNHPEKTSRFFCLHRLADLFGNLALVDHECLPALNVETIYGGHYSDLQAMKMAQWKPL